MSTIMPEAVRDRVEAGVAWLDQHDPGWWKVDQPGHGPNGGPIDLDVLDIQSPCRCVLGQRWGNYYSSSIGITMDEATDFGFDTAGHGRAEFEALGEEWTRVITERREAAALEGAAR